MFPFGIIIKMAAIGPTGAIVHGQRLLLLRHVARMPQNVPSNAILWMAYNIRHKISPTKERRRPRDRSPTTWVHQVCSNVGLLAHQALVAVQEQTNWQTITAAD